MAHIMNQDLNDQDEELTEEQIDAQVIADADDDVQWDEPIAVQKIETVDIALPAHLAGRARFLAHLHRARTLDEWLTRIIEERIELEEAAYATVKKELTIAQ